MLIYIPQLLKTQEMCKKVVGKGLEMLEFVPDCLKTQKMCEIAFKRLLSAMMYVPLISIRLNKYMKKLI